MSVGDRMIDRWFPCVAVDQAVGTPVGSGRSEKAIFTWFASRPIAQARAAVLASLLADTPQNRELVERAVREGKRKDIDALSEALRAQTPDSRPLRMIDTFSGRGMIPLEGARLGVAAVGLDYSPLATLAGRLLADYPLRDWGSEPPLPYAAVEHRLETGEPRLLRDVELLQNEVDQRVRRRLAHLYPTDANGRHPWAYLWALTLPCEGCSSRFPMVGSLVLRHPYRRRHDVGQSLRLIKTDDTWETEVVDGPPDQTPTLAAGAKGKKIARCLFCNKTYGLDDIKAIGKAGLLGDALLAVADLVDRSTKRFRPPSTDDLAAAMDASIADLEPIGRFSAVPDEPIPAGNEDTVRPSGYGYTTYGALMNDRQTLAFAETVRVTRECHAEMLTAGVSSDYAAALTGYMGANLGRRLRRSTRGVRLLTHGNANGTAQNRVQVSDLFSDESKISFGFDYVEAGIADGPGTWRSVSQQGITSLGTHLRSLDGGRPAKFRRGSAMALPFRDSTIDAVVVDPPYYNMIDYADTSDLFYAWIKRMLQDADPDLFGKTGLQDKADEIIVKRGGTSDDHRTEPFYEASLKRAFDEARRVITPEGALTVVFAHADPDAWVRLLTALTQAGFVVSSSWPSRTEQATTGVSSVRVTITIGCRVAEPKRSPATAEQVDREVQAVVASRVPGWEQDGLALPDQLMASYGPAMEVYGRYSRVVLPDNSEAGIERYLVLARNAVREAHKMKLDTLPLETFDAITRFAVFWLRSYGRTLVPKGEARFSAQADGLRIGDVRTGLLSENKSKGTYRLTLDPPRTISGNSSTFDVARAMAAAWDDGGLDAVAGVLRAAERTPGDEQVWAVVKDLAGHLPDSDQDGRRLTAIVRNESAIKAQATAWAARVAADDEARRAHGQQLELIDT